MNTQLATCLKLSSDEKKVIDEFLAAVRQADGDVGVDGGTNYVEIIKYTLCEANG
jgi:hypothetical protein